MRRFSTRPSGSSGSPFQLGGGGHRSLSQEEQKTGHFEQGRIPDEALSAQATRGIPSPLVPKQHGRQDGRSGRCRARLGATGGTREVCSESS